LEKDYLSEMYKAWGDEKKVLELQKEGMNTQIQKIIKAINSISENSMPFLISSLEIILKDLKIAEPQAAKLAAKFISNSTHELTIINYPVKIKNTNPVEIVELFEEQVKDLIGSCKNGKFEPIGLFYVVEVGPDGEEFYTGYDNSTGDCWVNCFDTLEDCLTWLRGREGKYDD
jgi:hypothetical protein